MRFKRMLLPSCIVATYCMLIWTGLYGALVALYTLGHPSHPNVGPAPGVDKDISVFTPAGKNEVTEESGLLDNINFHEFKVRWNLIKL